MLSHKKHPNFWDEIYYSPAFPLFTVGVILALFGLFFKLAGAFD